MESMAVAAALGRAHVHPSRWLHAHARGKTARTGTCGGDAGRGRRCSARWRGYGGGGPHTQEEETMTNESRRQEMREGTTAGPSCS